MTVEEIFKELSKHMIYGVMFHSQQTDYYDFLGLQGYKKMSEHHLFCEMKSLRKLHAYYLNHFNRLIEEDVVDNPQVIPITWYRYLRQDVDSNTKRNAVKSAFENWINWEESTKDIYEGMYKELIDINEVAAAQRITRLIKDVDKELKHAQHLHLLLKASDYSIDYILVEQDKLCKKYGES